MRYFLWAKKIKMSKEQKQLFNIRTKQEILVALGCKSLYKAAAAHVNNNARALRCRRMYRRGDERHEKYEGRG